jgi:hypothetical protein
MHWEEQFRRLAATQEAFVARFQVGAIGCTVHDWWHARSNGRWDAWSDRLLSLRGVPDTDGRRVVAGILDTGPGSVLHGPSTLAWSGLHGYGLRTIHVARPRGVSEEPSTLAVIHRLRAIRAQDVIVLRGVVTETPLRAIWSEAARFASPARVDWGVQRIGRLLDDAHKLGLVTWSALEESVDDLQCRGRAGTVIMRALAAARPPGSSPTESRQEDQLEKLLADVGAEPLARQPVVGGHELIGRCDHRDERRPLVVEVNSEIHHTTPSDVLADTLRYRKLNEAGFTVAVVWENDLWRDGAAVTRLVAEARRLADRGECVVVHSTGCPWPEPLPLGHRLH